MKRIILKIVKWIMITFLLLLTIVISLILYFKYSSNPDAYFGTQSEARNILFGRVGDTDQADKKLIEVKKMENSWREFDFRDIPGETPDTGANPEGYPALSKYRIQDIKVYKNIAFVTGDNRREESETRSSPGNPVTLDEAEEFMEAYVFRSKDGGKTFDKQCFGKGTAIAIKKINTEIYLTISYLGKKKATLLKSKDMGDTWEEVVHRPWAVFNNKIMIQGSHGSEQVTYDDGEIWKEVSENLQTYLNQFPKYERPTVYQNKLVKLQDRKLYFFDIEEDKEEIIPLNVPKGKIISGDLHSDKETGELSIPLFPDVVGNPREEQGSIWFPLENKEVVFDKKLPKPVFLKVHGKHIGGFTKVEGVLTHIWTMDKGKTWSYELLPNYFFEKNISFGNGQIWMEVLLRGKDGMQNGSYLAIGTLKEK